MKKINNKLDPNWVTGFVDGEGCFTLNIIKNVRYNTGWAVQPCFQIALHSRDECLLLQIKSFFVNTGKIWLKNNFVIYQVRSINDILRVIIPHFDKYPCITQKQSDFIIWKKIIELMNKGEHLNKDLLINIISLKACLNKGLSEKLKKYFPKITKINKPKQHLPENIDPNWIAGFFSGESCFFLDLHKSKNYKYNYAIKLRLLVGQHIKEELLMNSLINILGCGYVSKYIKKNYVIFTITKFDDIYNKVIPLLNKYRIIGEKYKDYKDFVLAAGIMKKKDHLTLKGIEQIRTVKSKMNKARYKDVTNVFIE